MRISPHWQYCRKGITVTHRAIRFLLHGLGMFGLAGRGLEHYRGMKTNTCLYPIMRTFHYPKTLRNLRRNALKTYRALEIGPGPERISGFETLDIVNDAHVDYVWNAAKSLPFDDSVFDLVYASHVLEHIPWYQVEIILTEWVRILKPAGRVEVWVPDGLKICQTLLDYELSGINNIDKDGWYKFNTEHDPCKWAAGRLFTYGDGRGSFAHPNWHRAIFTPRYLSRLFENTGLHQVRILDPSEVRGYDHGWISLGMGGVK